MFLWALGIHAIKSNDSRSLNKAFRFSHDFACDSQFQNQSKKKSIFLVCEHPIPFMWIENSMHWYAVSISLLLSWGTVTSMERGGACASYLFGSGLPKKHSCIDLLMSSDFHCCFFSFIRNIVSFEVFVDNLHTISCLILFKYVKFSLQWTTNSIDINLNYVRVPFRMNITANIDKLQSKRLSWVLVIFNQMLITNIRIFKPNTILWHTRCGFLLTVNQNAISLFISFQLKYKLREMSF